MVSSTPWEIHGQQAQPSPQLGTSPAPVHTKQMDRTEHGKLMRIKNRKAILEPLILQPITRIKGDKNQRYSYLHKSTLAKKTSPPEENHVLRCTETAGPERSHPMWAQVPQVSDKGEQRQGERVACPPPPSQLPLPISFSLSGNKTVDKSPTSPLPFF